MQLPIPLSLPNVEIDASTLLERRVLAGSRRRLARILSFEATPRRIVEIGRSGLDLEERFPDATIRDGSLEHWFTWARWPDVVWCDYAFTHAGPVDDVVGRLWAAVPQGALVAVVDAYSSPTDGMTRWLEGTLALQADPKRLSTLRGAFRPLHVSVLEQQGGLWRSFVFVGQR
jgi:hypothetical protein